MGRSGINIKKENHQNWWWTYPKLTRKFKKNNVNITFIEKKLRISSWYKLISR